MALNRTIYSGKIISLRILKRTRLRIIPLKVNYWEDSVEDAEDAESADLLSATFLRRMIILTAQHLTSSASCRISILQGFSE
jgi:hypothetical protein